MANSLARNVASRRISFVSWNVRGLGKPTKLNKVLSHLDNLGAQIAFIQETHLNVSDHTKVRRRWVSQSFHSLFNSKARGVARAGDCYRRTRRLPRATNGVGAPSSVALGPTSH